MPALVPELVDMASTPAVSTADLLRRALVVARRLDVPELADWITFELAGYGEREVPAYRRLTGNILPVPKQGESTEVSHIDPTALDGLIQVAAVVHVAHGISVIQGMAAAKHDLFAEKFPPKVDYLLQQRHIGNFTLARTTSPIQYQGIVDAVRTRILEWALDLEGRGVLGEGMTFTQQEKQTVQQIHNHFGNVSDSQIQISSNGSTQTQDNTTGTDLEALRGLIEALGAALDRGTVQGDAADELRAELATLKAQTGRSQI